MLSEKSCIVSILSSYWLMSTSIQNANLLMRTSGYILTLNAGIECICVLHTLLPLWYSLFIFEYLWWFMQTALCVFQKTQFFQLHLYWGRARHSRSLLCHRVTIRYLFSVWKGIQKACTVKTGATVKRGWEGQAQWNTGLVVNTLKKKWFQMLKIYKNLFQCG